MKKNKIFLIFNKIYILMALIMILSFFSFIATAYAQENDTYIRQDLDNAEIKKQYDDNKNYFNGYYNKKNIDSDGKERIYTLIKYSTIELKRTGSKANIINENYDNNRTKAVLDINNPKIYRANEYNKRYYNNLSQIERNIFVPKPNDNFEYSLSYTLLDKNYKENYINKLNYNRLNHYQNIDFEKYQLYMDLNTTNKLFDKGTISNNPDNDFKAVEYIPMTEKKDAQYIYIKVEKINYKKPRYYSYLSQMSRNDTDINLFYQDEFYYYKLSIIINDVNIKTFITEEIDDFNLMLRWEKISTVKINTNQQAKKHPDIEKLPRRTDGGFTGLHGQCYDIKINKNKLSFTVYYSGDIYHVKDVIFNTENDLNFLKGVKKFYYYTDGLDKIFYISYAENGDKILLTKDPRNAFKWRGVAFWNYSQNKIKVVKKAKILSYPEFDKDTNLSYYIVLPDVKLDEIIQISLSIKIQNTKTNQIVSNVFTFDEESESMVLPGVIRKQVSDYMNISGWTLFAAGVVSTIVLVGTGGAGISVVGATLAGGIGIAGGLGLILGAKHLEKQEGALQWGAYNKKSLELLGDKTPEHVKNNMKRFNNNQDFDTNKIYKLNLGTVSKDECKVLQDYTEFNNLIYTYDGELYVIDRNDKNLQNPNDNDPSKPYLPGGGIDNIPANPTDPIGGGYGKNKTFMTTFIKVLKIMGYVSVSILVIAIITKIGILIYKNKKK